MQEYTDWLAEVVVEAVRITKGYVLVVVDNCIRQGQYQPANETLLLKLHIHPDVMVDQPIIW